MKSPWKVASVLALMATQPVWGCGGDYECEPYLALQGDGLDCEVQSLPFLSPNNDLGTNLALLYPTTAKPGDATTQEPLEEVDLEQLTEQALPPMSELAGALGVNPAMIEEAGKRASGWLEGRCSLNRPQAATPFLQALQASGLPAEEQRQLAEARVALLGLCQSDTLPDFSTLPATPAAAGYSDYLRGARAFYLGDFQEAKQRFTALSQQEQPWLKETSSYLLARVALNQAQAKAVDDEGFFDPTKADQAALSEAEQAFAHYLATYPKGLYANSAIGLHERLYLLQGAQDKLGAIYLKELQSLKPEDDKTAVFTKIVRNLINEPGHDMPPSFLLIQDLNHLQGGGDPQWLLSAEALAAQQASFAAAGMQAEHDYLQLVRRYYIDHDYAGVMQAITPATDGQPLDRLTFSRQMLRGMALLAQELWPEAEAHWRQLWAMQPDASQKSALELAMAMTLERSYRLEAMFADDSLVTNPEWRLRLLNLSAPAGTLRKVVTDTSLSAEVRQTALSTLFSKQLEHSHFTRFLKDYAALTPLMPDPAAYATVFAQPYTTEEGYQCPSLLETVQQLAKPGAGARIRLCFDVTPRSGPNSRYYDEKPMLPALGGAGDGFVGPFPESMTLYQAVMTDPYAAAEEKSFALYKAINCFANQGDNHCGGGEEIPVEVRKGWFQTLKHRYAAMPWSKQQKYYW